MAVLCNRAGHYIFALWFLFFFYLSIFLFFPRLILAATDWMCTILLQSTHGVTLVRILNAGLKCAACGSLQIQDAKKSPKIAIWAPSHNFVRLYLCN